MVVSLFSAMVIYVDSFPALSVSVPASAPVQSSMRPGILLVLIRYIADAE